MLNSQISPLLIHTKVVLFAATVALVVAKLVFVDVIELFKVVTLLAIEFAKAVLFAATVVFAELRFVFIVEILEFIDVRLL